MSELSYYSYLRDDNFARFTNEEAIVLKRDGRYNDLFRGIANLAFSIGFNFARRRGFQKDDYISIANLSALESAKSWNPKKNSFEKHATICIKRSLIESCYNASIVKIPRPTWYQLSKLRKLTEQENYHNRDSGELALVLGQSKERVVELLDLQEILQLRKTANNFEKSFKLSTEFDCIELAPDIYPCLAEVENLLKFIDNEERKQLFVLKYGLLGNKVHSYTELTKKTLYTKDYIIYQIMLCIKELGEIINPTPKIVKRCEICQKSFTPVIGREKSQKSCGNRKCSNVLSSRRKRLKRQYATNKGGLQ